MGGAASGARSGTCSRREISRSDPLLQRSDRIGSQIRRSVHCTRSCVSNELFLCFRLVKLGKVKESIVSFETALRIDPQTPNAKQYLEKARGMAGKLGRSERPMRIRDSEHEEHATSSKRVVEEPVNEPAKKAHTQEIDQRLLELLKRDTASQDRSRSRSGHRHHHRHHHHRN